MGDRIRETRLDAETALLDGAGVMFRGQKLLVDMLVSCFCVSDSHVVPMVPCDGIMWLDVFGFK